METSDPILPPTTDSTTIGGESSEPRGPVPALSPPMGAVHRPAPHPPQ